MYKRFWGRWTKLHRYQPTWSPVCFCHFNLLSHCSIFFIQPLHRAVLHLVVQTLHVRTMPKPLHVSVILVTKETDITVQVRVRGRPLWKRFCVRNQALFFFPIMILKLIWSYNYLFFSFALYFGKVLKKFGEWSLIRKAGSWNHMPLYSPGLSSYGIDILKRHGGLMVSAMDSGSNNTLYTLAFKDCRSSRPWVGWLGRPRASTGLYLA